MCASQFSKTAVNASGGLSDSGSRFEGLNTRTAQAGAAWSATIAPPGFKRGDLWLVTLSYRHDFL
jgi:hypothetical protein